MLVVTVIWIAIVEKIKLGISQFVLTNSRLEIGTVSGDKASRLIDDV